MTPTSGKVRLQHELTGLRMNLVVAASSWSLIHRCVTSWQSAAVMNTITASTCFMTADPSVLRCYYLCLSLWRTEELNRN